MEVDFQADIGFIKSSDWNNLYHTDVTLQTRYSTKGIQVPNSSPEILRILDHEERGIISESLASALPLGKVYSFDVFGEVDLDEENLNH